MSRCRRSRRSRSTSIRVEAGRHVTLARMWASADTAVVSRREFGQLDTAARARALGPVVCTASGWGSGREDVGQVTVF